MTVLVLTEEIDPTADRVVDALAHRGVPVFRADTGWFPGRLTLDAQLERGRWTGVLRTPHREVALEDVRSIWYRRPTSFRFPPAMSGPERRYAGWEARLGLGGVLASLPVQWVNNPSREADASYKPHQLTVAWACGLNVPETLVTNDPEAVRRFATRLDGRLVVKPLGIAALNEQGVTRITYTHRLTHTDLMDLRGVDVTAHLFQEWIDKAYEVRVTAVGRRLFAAAIDAANETARIDWRADFSALSYRVVDVPEGIADVIGRYLDAFGLTYGAFDFAVTPADEWILFECNPGGQYGWLEENTGLPISEAIADVLEKGIR